MKKIIQALKILWWKKKGLSQEEMAQKMMGDSSFQEMIGKFQKAVESGRISRGEIMDLQRKMAKDSKAAEKDMKALYKRIE